MLQIFTRRTAPSLGYTATPRNNRASLTSKSIYPEGQPTRKRTIERLAVLLPSPALLVLVLGFGLLLTTSVMADITVTVDFTNAANTTFKDSDGANVTPTASGLAAADKATILANIKAKYAGIANVGTVTVTEGAVPAMLGPGQYAVVVSGGTAPSGTEWGDAGVDGGPSFVYLGAIKAYKEPKTNAMVTAQADIDTVVGETAAHELGHRVGKLGHNEQSAAAVPNMALMVAGSGITVAQRIADMRSFTAAEIKAIQMNFNKNTAPKPAAPGKKDLNAFYGLPMTNGIADDDNSWGAKIWFTGASGWEAGYINTAGQFVYETANQSPGSNTDPNTTFMGFLFPGAEFASWDMALEDPLGDVFDFETDGVGSPLLSDPNPLNPSDFLDAQLNFSINGEPFSIFLDNSTGEPTTGGFVSSIPVPEPPALSLLAVGLALLAMRRELRASIWASLRNAMVKLLLVGLPVGYGLR